MASACRQPPEALCAQAHGKSEGCFMLFVHGHAFIPVAVQTFGEAQRENSAEPHALGSPVQGVSPKLNCWAAE